MSDTSSDHIEEIPLDVGDAAATPVLPEKSKKQYEKVYQDFMKWRSSRNITNFSEKVVLEHFQDLSRKFKCSSLWARFSMLKITLSLKHGVNISKYPRVVSFLRQSLEGYKKKSSKTFSPDEINNFLNIASDRDHLLTKVALIFGIVGGCRRLEFYNLQFKDVELLETAILVKIKSLRNETNRKFAITGSYYDICKKYILLRPSPCDCPCFFLRYVNGKCFPQQVGLNKFGSLGKTIADVLKLPNPEQYTGHCFHKTSATLAVDSDGEEIILKQRRIFTAAEAPLNKAIEVEACTNNSMQTESEEYIQDLHSSDLAANEDQGSNRHFIFFEKNRYREPEIETREKPTNTTEDVISSNRVETYLDDAGAKNGTVSDENIHTTFQNKSFEFVNVNIPNISSLQFGPNVQVFFNNCNIENVNYYD